MAKWMEDFDGEYFCSECGRYVRQDELGKGYRVPDECPGCGSKMVCEYCENSLNFADTTYGPTDRIIVWEGCLIFDNSSEEYGSGRSIPIKYCPMCGKEI